MADTHFLYESDALNGKEGTGWAVIEGKKVEIFNFKNFKLKANFEQQKFAVVGTTRVQRKTLYVELPFSFTVYAGRREWGRIVKKYLNTGKETYFELIISNTDANSTVGIQTISIQRCKITSCDVIALDCEQAFLEQNVEGIASEIEFLEEFNDPREVGFNAGYNNDYDIVIDKPYPGPVPLK